MSNNTGIDKRDLSYTPDKDKRFRVMPYIIKPHEKPFPGPFPGPFPNIQVLEQQKTPYFDGLRENERSLISNNEKKEQKKGGSLKRKKRLSYKNKKRITRKMRKSCRNKRHK